MVLKVQKTMFCVLFYFSYKPVSGEQTACLSLLRIPTLPGDRPDVSSYVCPPPGPLEMWNASSQPIEERRDGSSVINTACIFLKWFHLG